MTTIFDHVIADLKERDKLGEKSYGGPMLADKRTLLGWMKEAYAEDLDRCTYMKAAILKLEHELAMFKGRQVRYDRSPKGVARRKRYSRTPKRRKISLDYGRTEKGIVRARRYRARPETKEHESRKARSRLLTRRLRSEAI